VFATVDGFFPVVPSESLVVTAGAFAAGGDQSRALIIAHRSARSVHRRSHLLLRRTSALPDMRGA
jgi:hypothetical protein